MGHDRGCAITCDPFPTYQETRNGSTTTNTRATYMLAGQATAVRTNGTFYYLLNDHLGSANMTVARDNGVISQRQRFLPFGGTHTTAGGDLAGRGFTGHLHNDGIGLIYMNARYYVPSLGRFASADTIVPDPTNPQAFNRFSYVRNNPVNLIDPTGHWDCVANEHYSSCMDAVQTWLDILKSGGDTSYGVYLWFLDFDAKWIESNGYGVLFEFGNASSPHIPFCGGSGGVCSLIEPAPKMVITSDSRKYLNNVDFNIRMASILAHEFTHWYQGNLGAASILSEAQGNLVQSIVQQELGLAFNEMSDRLPMFIYNQVRQDRTYGSQDIWNFRIQLATDLKWILPSGCASACPVGEPIAHYQAIAGQSQRQQQWDQLSSAYGMR